MSSVSVVPQDLRVYETTLEECETRQTLVEAAQSFINTIEFYKAEHSGGKSHQEAVEESLKAHEWRRQYVSDALPIDVTWGHVAAIAEISIEDALALGHVFAKPQMTSWQAVFAELR